MKRPLLASTFGLLGTAAALLLAASIFYSCRTGGDPHHSGAASMMNTPPPSHSDHSAEASMTAPNAKQVTVAHDGQALSEPALSR